MITVEAKTKNTDFCKCGYCVCVCVCVCEGGGRGDGGGRGYRQYTPEYYAHFICAEH